MVVFLIHKGAEGKGSHRVEQHQQMESHRGQRRVDDDLPEVPDIKIQGIHQEQPLDRLTVPVNGVKDGRYPHDQLGHHTPQVLHIPEEDKQRGKDEPQSQVKDNEAQDRVYQEQKPPCEGHPVDGYKEEIKHQRQSKIDKRRNVLGKEEQVFGNIDLCKNVCVTHQRGHPQIGGIGEVGKHQLAGKEVDDIVLHVVSEEIVEHHPHDQKIQQRR